MVTWYSNILFPRFLKALSYINYYCVLVCCIALGILSWIWHLEYINGNVLHVLKFWISSWKLCLCKSLLLFNFVTMFSSWIFLWIGRKIQYCIWLKFWRYLSSVSSSNLKSNDSCSIILSTMQFQSHIHVYSICKSTTGIWSLKCKARKVW